MTDDDYEAWEHPTFAGGPDIELLERLVRLRWLLEQPLRLRITMALILYSSQNEHPCVSNLAAYLGEDQDAVLEQLQLMRHQGVIAGTFWLHDDATANGTVQLVPGLESALPPTVAALGAAPSSNLPEGPSGYDADDDRHLRAPSGDELIQYSYYLARQYGESETTTTTIVALGRLLAHPLRIEVLVQLIRNPGSTTEQIAAVIEEDRLATERIVQQRNPQYQSRVPTSADDVANRIRELADYCGIVPVPENPGRWMLSEPMRAVFRGAHEYLVALRHLDEASTLPVPSSIELSSKSRLN